MIIISKTVSTEKSLTNLELFYIVQEEGLYCKIDNKYYLKRCIN